MGTAGAPLPATGRISQESGKMEVGAGDCNRSALFGGMIISITIFQT
jgi:hypothetical protein